MIARSPACSASSPRGKMTCPSADDGAHDRALPAAGRGRAGRCNGLSALIVDLDHLGQVVLDHREGLRARVVGEAHDLLGRDRALVERQVDAGLARRSARSPGCRRPRSSCACRAPWASSAISRSRPSSSVQQTMASASPTFSRARNSGSAASASKTSTSGELLGAEPRAHRVDLDHAHPQLEARQVARDLPPGGAAAGDHDLLDAALLARRQALRPLLGRRGRGDDDDAVVVLEAVAAAGDDHAVAADDRGQHGLRRARRPRPRSCRRAPPPCSASSTNSTISTRPPAKTSVCTRRRHADGAGDGLRDLDLGRDHEVDVELPLAPGLQVLGALRARDDLPAAQRAGLQRGDDVDLVAVRRRDHEVGAADAGAHQDGARGAVALDRQDVVAVAERVEAGRVEIDDRDVMLPRAATPPRRSRPAPRR